MYHNLLFLGIKKHMTKEVLMAAERNYIELRASGEWMGKGKGSAFNAGSCWPCPLSEIQCWKCHQKGHKAKDCPNMQGEKEGGEQGSGRERNFNPLHRHPPVAGELHQKEFSGQMLHWCGKCKLWINHGTDEHIEGYKRNMKKVANVADASGQSKMPGGEPKANFMSSIKEQHVRFAGSE